MRSYQVKSTSLCSGIKGSWKPVYHGKIWSINRIRFGNRKWTLVCTVPRFSQLLYRYKPKSISDSRNSEESDKPSAMSAETQRGPMFDMCVCSVYYQPNPSRRTNQSPPSSDSCEAQHTHVLAARQVLVMTQEATTDAYSVAIPTVLHAPSGVPRALTPPLPHPPPSIPTQEEGRGVSNRDNESWCEGG